MKVLTLSNSISVSSKAKIMYICYSGELSRHQQDPYNTYTRECIPKSGLENDNSYVINLSISLITCIVLMNKSANKKFIYFSKNTK